MPKGKGLYKCYYFIFMFSIASIRSLLVHSFHDFALPNLRRSMLMKGFFMKSMSIRRSPSLLYSSVDDGVNDFKGFGYSPAETKIWNMKGLKSEVNRMNLRLFKKTAKANERLNKAQKEYDEVVAMVDPTVEQLENCPVPETFREKLTNLQNQLLTVQQLEDALKPIKSQKNDAFEALLPLIDELELSDSPPAPQPRGPKKPKGKKPEPRLPYIKYTSSEGIEIRVGRGASDNDDLSCNPVYRDGANWWMHVSGYPGSHIVIRSEEDDIMTIHKQTVIDAALLTAVNSKAKKGGRVPVSLTRCRHVTKPKGAKPGLVHLSGGDIATISINIKEETERLNRLETSRD